MPRRRPAQASVRHGLKRRLPAESYCPMTIQITLYILVTGAFVAMVGYHYFSEVRVNPAYALMPVTLYSLTSKQASLYFLDIFPIYITESQTISSPSAASFQSTVINIVIIAAVVLTTRALNRPFGVGPRMAIQIPTIAYRRLAAGLVFATLGIQILNILATGEMALPGSGVDRFNYWTEYATLSFLPTLFGQLMLFVPMVLSVLYLYYHMLGHSGSRKLIGLGLLMYFVVLIIHGQRFHGLLTGMSYMFGMYAIWCVLLQKPIVDRKIVSIAVGMVAILFVYLSYAFQFRGVSEYAGGAILGIGYRVLVLQGHTFWNAHWIYETFGSAGALANLVDGMALQLDAIGSRALSEGFTDRGVNFSTTLSSTTVLIGGFPLALICCAIYGALLGATLSVISLLIRRGNIILLFPAVYVWTWIGAVNSKGSLETVVNTNFVLFVFLMLGMIFLHYHLSSRPPRPLSGS